MTADDFTDRIRRVGIVVWSIVGVLVLVGILVWLLAQAHVIVIPVVFAGVIVYLANPVVRRLAAVGVPRAFGTLFTYVVFAAALFALGLWMAPAIQEQAGQLIEQLPVIYDDLASRVESLLALVGFEVVIYRLDELAELIPDLGADFQTELQSLVGQAFDVALGVFEAVALFLIAPVIAFYVLVDLPRLEETGLELMPGGIEAESRHVLERLGRALGGFVRGQLVAATVVALLSAIGYRLVGLELWLIIAIIAGLFNMIPFVGPWVAGLLAVGVALVTGDLTTVVGAAIVALAVQQLDNHFVSPLVLRATVKLHPALIILALLVGGSVGGLLGVVLAVPVLAVTKVLVSHFWRTRVLGEPWEQAVESIVYQTDPSATAEMLAVRLRRRQAEEMPNESTSDQDE